MAVDIYFGDDNSAPLRVGNTYSKESLALALSGEGAEGRVGAFVRVTLNTDDEVLINPASVSYLREQIS